MANEQQSDISAPEDLPSDPFASYNPDQTVVLGGHRAGRFTAPPRLPVWSLAPEGATNPPPDYVLKQLSGTGGFGEVWEAVQASLQRTVAVKMLRDDFLSRTQNSPALIIDTFRQEAITAARLEHPNIVPMYDLGEDGKGRPVMVMKYVRGKLWSEILDLDFARLTPPEFLAKHLPTLATVTQAVAYAHSREVIHRDLKPSQVIIGEYGEVQLMDWGLAVDLNVEHRRAAGYHDVPLTNPAGTVAYMAPEQTDSTGARLGTWTDVYLLGGTLYTLLTGLAPHPASNSRAAFSQAKRGTFAPPREAAPHREHPDDLVSLVMAALEPDLTLRLKSADLFLARLNDYLSGAGKRRESNAQAVRAAERLDAATGYDDYSSAIGQLASALAAWPQNEMALRLQEEATERFTRAALANRDLVLARFQAQQVRDEERRNVLGDAIDAAERDLERSARQRRWSFAAIGVLVMVVIAGWASYTRLLAAERDRSRRASIEEARARQQAEDLLTFMLTDLKASLDPIGRLDLLDKVTRQATQYFATLPDSASSSRSMAQRAQLLDAVGEVLVSRGELPAASRAFKEALSLREKLAAREPRVMEWQAELAQSQYYRGVIAHAQGDDDAALQAYESAYALQKKALTSAPSNDEWRRRLASNQMEVGELHRGRGETARALEQLRAGAALMQKLYEEQPADGERLRDVAVSHSQIGDAFSDAGDASAALEEYRIYARLMQQLVNRAPQNLQWQRELAVSHNSIGWALRAQGNTAGALEEFRLQQKLMTAVVAREPGNSNWQRELAFSSAVIGRTLRGIGDLDGAKANLRRSRDILQVFAEKDPSNNSWRRDLAVAQSLYADALAVSGDRRFALLELESAIAAMRPLVAREPENVGWRHDLAKFLRLAGRVELESGLRAEGVKSLEEAVRLMEPLTRELDEAAPTFLDTHAVSLLLLGRNADAKPFVDALLKKEWNDPEFNALVKK